MSYIKKKTKILKLEFENWKLIVGSRELLIKGVTARGVTSDFFGFCSILNRVQNIASSREKKIQFEQNLQQSKVTPLAVKPLVSYA